MKYLNPKNLNKEVDRYGYRFTLSGYIKYLICVFGGIVGISFVLRLEWQYIISVAVISALFLPSVFLMTFRNMYEEKKFEDITAYMEQLLYSFKRQPKILDALQDTLILFREGEAEEQNQLYVAINKAIEHIQNGYTEGNIYHEAFAFIEEEYGCKRLYKIHDFLIKVEGAGGDSSDSLDILLDDRKLWIDRIYELLRDKKNIKVKVTICIGLSFLICGLAIYMLPEEFAISKIAVSQIATTVVIIANMLIWYFVQRKLSGSLTNTDEDSGFEEIRRRYDFVMHGDLKKAKKKALIASIVLIPAVPIMYFKISALAAVLCVGLIYIVGTQPTRRYRASMRKVKKEVEKVFPEWLMVVSLQLQTDNVYVSISKTIETAPIILREELGVMQKRIEEQTDSLQPYILFFQKLNIPDITSAMKMLYSMAQFGAADIQKQIRGLVQRNAILMDKSERIRMEDHLAGIGFMALLPMLTGVVKMMADLMLVIFSILSIVQDI